MKKIAIISYGGLPLPPVKGGAVENLIHALVENNEIQKQAELTVFSVHHEAACAEARKYKNTEFVYVGTHKRANAITGFTNRVFRRLGFGATFQIHPYLMEVVKKIRNMDFDCVLVENRAEFMPYLRKKVNLPLLLHVHNDHLCKDYFLADKIFKSTDRFLAVSDYVKNRILTIDNQSNKVVVLRNVIDVDRFMHVPTVVRDEVRQRYNIQPEDTVFAFFGRITPSKGVGELFEAFLQVAQKHSNVKLLVVGAKWFGDNTENAYMKHLHALSVGAEGKIIFTGYVDYQNIAQQYACADVVMVPSVAGEASALVSMEAMASGKALIVSDSGGIHENVDASCAIEVPRGEGFVDGLTQAMDRLVTDKALLETMGKNGQARAHVHDKKQYLKELLELI